MRTQYLIAGELANATLLAVGKPREYVTQYWRP